MNDTILCQYLRQEIKRKRTFKVDKHIFILDPEPILSEIKRHIFQLPALVFLFVPLPKYLAYSCSCGFTRVIYMTCLHDQICQYVFFMSVYFEVQLCSVLWDLHTFMTCAQC